MDKVNLILVDSNLDYLHRFSRYIRDSEYSKIFAIKIFTDIDLLQEYLKEISRPSILCFVDFMIESVNINNKYFTKVIISAQEVGEEDDFTKIVYKYQPLNLIISAIYSHYLNNHQSNHHSIRRATKIITITAASSDYHKNELSLLLARHLASTQHNVFYLNLGVVSSLDYFLHKPHTYDLSKIIYHLKKNPENISAYIERYKKEQTYLQFDYFERVQHINDLLELNQFDLINLLNGFKNLYLYDYIVVLLDSAVVKLNLAAMNEADYRLMLVEDNQYSLGKVLLIQDYLAKLQTEAKINLDYILLKETETDQQLNITNQGISFVGYVVKQGRTQEINSINLDNYFVGLKLYLNKLVGFHSQSAEDEREEY